MCAFRYCAMPIAARMTMTDMTMASSIIVKAASDRRSSDRRSAKSLRAEIFDNISNPLLRRSPDHPIADLPVSVFRSVERHAVKRGEDVEHVLSAPPGRVG